ncbi:MAG: hypothetical protein D6675_08215 [Gemmatimonadetes bacterium]|nr:MAG: hypothetical protein D6675_08215 [Gemmatimonadota bacterium]
MLALLGSTIGCEMFSAKKSAENRVQKFARLVLAEQAFDQAKTLLGKDADKEAFADLQEKLESAQNIQFMYLGSDNVEVDNWTVYQWAIQDMTRNGKRYQGRLDIVVDESTGKLLVTDLGLEPFDGSYLDMAPPSETTGE